jgi:hypothetical protein
MSLSCQRPRYFSFHKRQQGCLAGISGKVRVGNLISHMIVMEVMFVFLRSVVLASMAVFSAYPYTGMGETTS